MSPEVEAVGLVRGPPSPGARPDAGRPTPTRRARRAVMEGRDIGSVVFADAPVKLYLVADADRRAERRADQRRGAAAAAGRNGRSRIAMPGMRAPRPHVRRRRRRRHRHDRPRRRSRRSWPPSLAVGASGAGAALVSAPAASPRSRWSAGRTWASRRSSTALFGRRESDRPRHARRHARPGGARGGLARQAVRSRRHRRLRAGARGVEELAREQADTRDAAEADLILLVVDAQAGITEEDAALARRLRRAQRSRARRREQGRYRRGGGRRRGVPSRSGLGSPFAVSGMHGRATGDLLDRIVELLPDAPEVREDDRPTSRRFAMVGRPNVGKSSLFNRAGRGGALRRVRGGGHDA